MIIMKSKDTYLAARQNVKLRANCCLCYHQCKSLRSLFSSRIDLKQNKNDLTSQTKNSDKITIYGQRQDFK